jgi:GGDEF domain-containing protein
MGALVQAAVRIYLSLEQRKIAAEREFDTIVGLALADGRRGFMDERFIETMNNALKSAKCIEALIVSGPEGEYAFERQEGYAVNWVNNSPRFISRWDFSNITYNRSLSIENLRNATIKAKARAIDYAEFSRFLKETLLIILIGFAVSFFTMLMQHLAGGGSKKNEKTAPAPVPVYREREPAREYVPAARDVQRDIEIENTESGPKGLYSSRSNIGWEEYTKDRLDSELHRCASTEKDLTLIYMDFTDIATDAMYRQAAEEAVAFFTSRDLLFECGKYGVCAILPGINLETGILKAEKFYQRFLEKFPGGSRYSSCLCIGISSRSGRLLNADRLMLETAEALNKAGKDPKSPIIAFKSDLDRYRTFIAAQN